MATTTVTTGKPELKDLSGFRSSEHRAMSEAWETVDDLWRASVWSDAEKKKYLQQFPRESSEAYAERLKWRANYFDMFKPTLRGFSGMVFKKPIVPKEPPKALAELFPDFDLCGNDVHTFLMNAYEEFLKGGNGFFLADTQPLTEEERAKVEAGEKLTLRDREGHRPFCVFFKASQLINHRYVKIDGREIFDQLTFRMCLTEPDGEFGERKVIKHFILRRGSYEFRTFKDENDRDGEYFIKPGESGPMATTSTGEIPVTAITDIGTEPPFYGIAKLNIAHFNKSSDYAQWCHDAFVPQRWFRFDSEDDAKKFQSMTASSKSALVGWGEHFGCGFLEVTGSGCELAVQDIKNVESQIARLGIEKMSPTVTEGPKTATEVNSDNIQNISELAMLTRRFQNAVEKTFYNLCEMFNQIRGPKTVDLSEAELTKMALTIDYNRLTFDINQLQFFNSLVDTGKLSLETFLTWLPQVTDLPDGFTVEDELERIKNQPKPEAKRSEAGV